MIATTFLPLGPKVGGNSKKTEVNKNDTIGKDCLTLRQADYIYKKVELGSLINKKQKLDRMDNNSRQKPI